MMQRNLKAWESLRTFGLTALVVLLCPAVLFAGTSQFPNNWSFEADAPGTEYVDITGLGPDGWGGDATTATSAMAVVVGEIYTNQYTGAYPLPGATHTNVLAFEGSISNLFETYPVASLFTNVIIDVMLQPGYYTSEPQIDSNPQVAAYVNTSGHVVVKHAYYNGDWSVSTAWTELEHTPIGSSDWARVTLELDYLSSQEYEDDEHFFTIAINGDDPITNALAYTSPTIGDPITDRGGSWFMTADAGADNPDGGPRNKWFTSLELQGVGSIDDLVINATGERSTSPPTPFDEWYDGHALTEGRDGDDDHDGASNWEEYLSGTDPNNPASLFRVIAQNLVNGTNWVSWLDGTNSPVTTDFMMYRSTNLLGAWGLIASGIPRSASGTNVWPDNAPPAGPAYYQPRLPDSE